MTRFPPAVSDFTDTLLLYKRDICEVPELLEKAVEPHEG
jgi:hypothetical protein